MFAKTSILPQNLSRLTQYLGLLAWALLAFYPQIGQAAELYNSGGFEVPRFAAGNLGGQDAPPTGQGPWVKDSGTGTAVVENSVVAGGLQAVQLTRPASSTGDTRLAVVKPFTPTTAENGVRIDVDMRVNQATFSGTPPNNTDFGPAFGLEVYDATVANSPLLIGSLTVDATTGDVLYQQAGTGFLTETGTVLTRNVFHHFTLTVNFTNKTYTIFANGISLRTEGFVDNAAARFTDAPLSVISATGTSVNTGTGTAFFDNYVINTIPEPTTGILVLASLCLVLASRRRTHL